VPAAVNHILQPHYFHPRSQGQMYSLKSTIVQLAEALCYKSEGRGFNSRWYQWKFLLT
jgi:hypothetical protein